MLETLKIDHTNFSLNCFYMKISYDFLWQLHNFLQKLCNNKNKIKTSRVGGIFRVGRVTPIQLFFCPIDHFKQQSLRHQYKSNIPDVLIKSEPWVWVIRNFIAKINTEFYHNVRWEAEGHNCSSKLFRWEPEGHYHCTNSMAIAPFWLSTSLNCNNALLALNWR